MKQKLFYQAFNIIKEDVKYAIPDKGKEAVYSFLFSSLYQSVKADLYDGDQIRKITSGNMSIHSRVVKQMHTEKGFEIFRRSIEDNCLPYLSDRKKTIDELTALLNNADNIPDDIVVSITRNIDTENEYKLSKAIAGILDCLNYSDYLVKSGKGKIITVDYMRLSSDKPVAVYPKYITDPPNTAVDNLIGRKYELKTISSVLFDYGDNLLISGVGGLGKTELVKEFLSGLIKTKTDECGIEAIAWVSYIGDFRLCLKQAFNLRCELDEVWAAVQDIVNSYNRKVLLVVDNIENSDDEYLKLLHSLPCRIIATSRQRELTGFKQILALEPLKMDECRELFYMHYDFPERNNETLNDIIDLTARLTIIIVLIAKISTLEEFGINELYKKIVALGFKLSNEDVSCEHEKLQDDATIIEQTCKLFSLFKFSNEDKKILTYISLIPNLRFDFPKAKEWFKIQKNSSLMKLFKAGMLEQVTTNRKHIYWMHSVIAASVREQQKEHLYDISRPFIDIMTDELDFQKNEGREFEKAYLIPFSWSVADIMENHWNNEYDTQFLNNLFHICFACSNYYLCEHLIDKVIEIQINPENDFDFTELAYSYRNKIDLLLQYDKTGEAAELLKKSEELFDANNATDKQRSIMDFQYGVLYQIMADYDKSRVYMQKCIDTAETDETATMMEKSTSYYNMGRMLLDAGEYFEAYKYTKKAIELDTTEDNSAKIISYCTLGSICSELVGIGYADYTEEARECFIRSIKFREKNLGKNHADTAVAYHDYALFLLTLGYTDKTQLEEALKYNEKAGEIEARLFSEHSMSRMRNLNTKALIFDEMGRIDDALEIYKYIMDETTKMGSYYNNDIALFTYNYAVALRDRGRIDEAFPLLERSIDLWKSLSESGSRNLAQAYMRCGECQYIKGDKLSAIDSFIEATKYVNEDLYLLLSLMDNIASIYIMIDKNDEGGRYYAEMLQKMTEYNVTDTTVKTEFCTNLTDVLSAEYDYENDLKAQIIKKLNDKPQVLSYIKEFFENIS